jgi:hypothetical protein
MDKKRYEIWLMWLDEFQAGELSPQKASRVQRIVEIPSSKMIIFKKETFIPNRMTPKIMDLGTRTRTRR